MTFFALHAFSIAILTALSLSLAFTPASFADGAMATDAMAPAKK